MTGLDSTVLALYRAAHETPLAEFQNAAMHLLKSQVRFDGCKWGDSQVDERGALFQSVHLYDDDPEGAMAYNEVRHEDRAARWVIDHRGTTGNFNFTSYFDHLSAIGNYIHRYRHSNALITGLPSTDARAMKSVSIYRANPDEVFSELDRQTIQSLVPHLNEALSVSRLIAAERFRIDAKRRWAVAIADHTGVLQFADPEFEAMMEIEWPSGLLRRLPANARDALLHENGNNQYNGRTLIMRSMTEPGSLFIKARTLMSADGLTKRELSVVQAIAKGLTHKEIARLLQLAPATVRNHIQTIHGRLGVSTNAELVALVLNAGY